MKTKVLVTDVQVLNNVLATLRTKGCNALADELVNHMNTVIPAEVTFDDMTDEVRKLHSLCQDPQPGFMTWHEFLNYQMKSLMTSLVNKVG